jgi:hypothetical protein
MEVVNISPLLEGLETVKLVLLIPFPANVEASAMQNTNKCVA